MGKISSPQVRILGAIVALTLVLGLFQNCGISSDFGRMKASNKAKGNGEGYGGKVVQFAHLGLKCNDDLPAGLIEKRGDDFFVLRENCAVVSEMKIGAGQVDLLSHASNLALYDSKVYSEYTPGSGPAGPQNGGGRAVKRVLCRGADTLVAYPREVIDTTVTDQPDIAASVKIVRYSSEGVVSGGVTDISFLTAYQSSGGSAPTETFTGQVPAGESFSLVTRTGGSPSLSFSLKLGASTYTRSPQVSCYNF